MQTNLFTLLFIIGASFSLIAAVMAYLISYTEYVKHFIDKRKPIIMALEAAAVIFALFMVISIVIAFFFGGSAITQNPSR
jgi:uncharacterized membrane protein